MWEWIQRREESLSACGSGSSRGSKLRVRAGMVFVHRLAAAVRMEGEPRVVECDRQRYPAATAADDIGIDEYPSRWKGGHSASPSRGAYGSSGRAAVAGLHSRGGGRGRGRGPSVGSFFHE